MWMETDIGQLNIAAKLKVLYEGPYIIRKQLGALDYELHMDHGKMKVVHHNRLKPYHGLKRPSGYYCALPEAKRDDCQPQVPVESQGQRLTPVSQVRWMHRQRKAPLLTELVCLELIGWSSSCCGSCGPQAGWLYSPMLEDVAVRGVLTMLSFLSRMFQCVKCEFSQSRTDEVVQHFVKEHLKPSEVPFVCDQCQFRACTKQAMVDHRRGEHQAP